MKSNIDYKNLLWCWTTIPEKSVKVIYVNLSLVCMKHVRDDWALQDNTVDTLNFPWSVFVQHTTLSNPRHHTAPPNISHTSQTTKSLFFVPVFFLFSLFFFLAMLKSIARHWNFHQWDLLRWEILKCQVPHWI